MTVEELAEEVMAPRLHMASFALQLENLQDDPFAPGRYKWGWLTELPQQLSKCKFTIVYLAGKCIHLQ